MALQKKNNLLRAHLTVALFWFVVLFFASQGFDLKLLVESGVYAMMVVILGILSGVVLWVAFDMSRRGGILSKSDAHYERGAKSSIGSVPVAQEPERGTFQKDMLARRFLWWGGYSSKYPDHAQAVRAVLAVMSANPRLPASPVPGGHGGATLIEHSFNVVDTMLEMAPKWVYRGHKNKKGEISFPLLDTTRAEYRFDRDDPILVLTAFAHDIGKVACYQMDEEGSVTEVRKNHDIEGAKLLRSIPEIMALSWKDRVAILTACEFYHHIGSLPHSTWIDDRARSLVELLIAADITTGQREGGVIVNDYEDSDVEIPALSEDSGGDAAPDEEEEDGQAHALPQSPAVSAAHGSPLDIAYSILLEPGRVNGTNTSTRIAWKYGEWLYINDAKLRNAVAERLGDSDYAKLPHRGNMHPFTLDLLAQLAANGNLLQEHENRKYSEKRAIYTTRSAVPGKTPVDSKFVIVAKTAAFPGLENAADCKAQPVIVGCSWGETAALNKNLGEWEPMGKNGDADQDVGRKEEATRPDEVDLLIDAAAAMKLPYAERSVDGVSYLFFEERLLMEEFPEAVFCGEKFIRKTGADSGKTFIGVMKK